MLKNIIVFLIAFFSSMSVADNGPFQEIQPFPEYLENYIKKLITISCEQTLKNSYNTSLIEVATQGMKKNSLIYHTVYNTIALGSDFGNRLKEKGKIIIKENFWIDNCSEVANYIITQKKIIKLIMNKMVSHNGEQPTDSKLKKASLDEQLYRTTARALTKLYSDNEITASKKISGHKIEITGTVQEVAKNFVNDIVLRVESGDRFWPVNLSMENSAELQASKLKKGQKVVVTCEKVQFFIGAPSGSNCTFN
ncbi:hypothetical protein PS037_23635 (plasmid) [Escherichia albertii]|uniref:OB-fold protein n=1 Tax=Escherichia albertii TaxID=208962 RepID=UPI0023612423|nr:hypothetical protein [Escherichia albertii]WDB54710.1 hypothetical protein PS037_23635 [Escherichia albertii]